MLFYRNFINLFSLDDLDSPLVFPNRLVHSMIKRIGNEDTKKRKSRERFETVTEQRLMARYGLERTLTGFASDDLEVTFGGDFLIMSRQGNVSVPSKIYFNKELRYFVLDYLNAWISYYS